MCIGVTHEYDDNFSNDFTVIYFIITSIIITTTTPMPSVSISINPDVDVESSTSKSFHAQSLSSTHIWNTGTTTI